MDDVTWIKDGLERIENKLDNMNHVCTTHGERITALETVNSEHDKAPNKTNMWSQIVTAVVAVVAVLISVLGRHHGGH